MTSFVRATMAGLLALVGVVRPPLAAQSNLTATATAPTTVALTWTAAPNAVRYWVQRAVGSATLANLPAPKITDTSYVDAGAPAGTKISYRVMARIQGGSHTHSATVSVTTPPTATSTAAAPATLPAPVSLAPATAPAPVAVTLAPVAVTLASPPPGMPTVAPTVSKTAALGVGQPLPEQPSGARLTAAPPVAAPAPTVTPVNPSGFTAKQWGDGQVKLQWQPVDGASYYVLLGPGLPEGGTKVSGETTFFATAVPPGTHEWAVASYYEPGPVSTPASEFPRAGLTLDVMQLSGWVDLHTHPMINLAFGGKLVHGGPDVGSLLPQDVSCHGATRATSEGQALSDDRPSHGGWNLLDFPCGDNLRQLLHHEFQQGNGALLTGGAAKGYPDFLEWPKWNDITHQKMWYEWIRRARDGGLRVMVALATNNKTLGDAVSGPGDAPTDDRTSADLQLGEMKAFVARHSDFMEVAFGAADVKRIVQAGKIAVVLGLEIDNIGNFNRLPAGLLSGPAGELPQSGKDIISGEIQRLYDAGARYILPIHVVDNAFGGTAIYKDDFNTSNLREAGHFWDIECADGSDDITHTYTDGYDPLRAAAAFLKLGLDPARRSGPGPTCQGHRNKRGLTLQGIYAIKQMMKRGMIVDIDHMSHHSAETTLDIAEQFGYPIVSGHTGIRGQAGGDAENSRTRSQMQRISKLHGMLGLGSDGVSRSAWASQYQTAMNIMGYQSRDTTKAIYRDGAISFGTDLNGLVKGPMPGGGNRVVYDASFPKSSSGSKSWDYNTDGVVHYGMLADFVRDVRTAPSNNWTGPGGVPLGVNGAELVDNHLNASANYFWQMWVQIEARKGNVQ
jgi:hypothetical protein